MNINEYKEIVYEFFRVIFNSKYKIVSIPFIIGVSFFSWLITHLYYKLKISTIHKKYTLENISMYQQISSLRNSREMASLELYPTLSNYYNIYSNSNPNPNNIQPNQNVQTIIASAPPQYIVQQNDYIPN